MASHQGYTPLYISGCFVALCEAPGHGEEGQGRVRTLISVPLSTLQCPRSGDLLRKEAYLAHSCEGPSLRDVSEGDVLPGKLRGHASYYTVKDRVHTSVLRCVHVCLCPQVSLYKAARTQSRATCLMINTNHFPKASLWVPQLDYFCLEEPRRLNSSTGRLKRHPNPSHVTQATVNLSGSGDG